MDDSNTLDNSGFCVVLLRGTSIGEMFEPNGSIAGCNYCIVRLILIESVGGQSLSPHGILPSFYGVMNCYSPQIQVLVVLHNSMRYLVDTSGLSVIPCESLQRIAIHVTSSHCSVKFRARRLLGDLDDQVTINTL
jgi:hypothetical protein